MSDIDVCGHSPSGCFGFILLLHVSWWPFALLFFFSWFLSSSFQWSLVRFCTSVQIRLSLISGFSYLNYTDFTRSFPFSTLRYVWELASSPLSSILKYFLVHFQGPPFPVNQSRAVCSVLSLCLLVPLTQLCLCRLLFPLLRIQKVKMAGGISIDSFAQRSRPSHLRARTPAVDTERWLPGLSRKLAQSQRS